jgi:hypothetical protein
MKTAAQNALGTEPGADGRRIGRDPRTMSQDELRAMGHVPMSPGAALRAHCLDCFAGPAERDNHDGERRDQPVNGARGAAIVTAVSSGVVLRGQHDSKR